MCRRRWARLGAAVLRQFGGIKHDGDGRKLELGPAGAAGRALVLRQSSGRW